MRAMSSEQGPASHGSVQTHIRKQKHLLGNAAPLMVADYRCMAALLVEFGDSCNSATKKTCGDFFGNGLATGVTPPVAFLWGRCLWRTAAPSFQSTPVILEA